MAQQKLKVDKLKGVVTKIKKKADRTHDRNHVSIQNIKHEPKHAQKKRRGEKVKLAGENKSVDILRKDTNTFQKSALTQGEYDKVVRLSERRNSKLTHCHS